MLKLLEYIVQFIELFYFIRVINSWEVSVVLRLGRYHRTLRPGWHFVIPLHIETLTTEWTVPQCKVLPSQNLTTADGKSVLVTPVITWSCSDAKRMLLKVGGHETVLLDSSCGVVARLVSAAAWAQLNSEPFVAGLTRAVRRRAKRWGIKVHEVQLSDVTLSRTFRLVSPPPSSPPPS